MSCQFISTRYFILDTDTQIHVESWAKLAPRPEKRKHSTGMRTKEEGGSKRPANTSSVQSKSVPMLKFTVALAEKPKTVHDGDYRMPDSGRYVFTTVYE